MSSSKTPCASCKTLRRKCISECVFAPYFPPDQPQRFESIHRVYGASNVAKILSDLPTTVERADAVTSLVYEAEARLKDPIYGCVGSICLLQHKLKRIQSEIESAKLELATFVGPSAMNTVLNTGFMPQLPDQHIIGSKLEQPEASGNNRQLYEAQQQQLVEEQDMLKNLEHHQQQQMLHYQQQLMDMWRFNRCSDGAGSSGQAQQQQPHPQQQEQDLHLQQLVQRQVSLQHQNQPPQP